MNRLQRNLQSLTTLVLLAWWISFTFYSAVVVPIGTELFDAMHQGLITQRVTNVLNLLTGIYLLIHLVEFFILPNQRYQKILWAIIALSLGGLLYLHIGMDPMIDFANLEISDRREFYRLHRLYLWICTAGWAAGGMLAGLRLFGKADHSDVNS